MLDALDLQGILDRAGIVVPPQVARFFEEDAEVGTRCFAVFFLAMETVSLS